MAAYLTFNRLQLREEESSDSVDTELVNPISVNFHQQFPPSDPHQNSFN